LNTPVNTFTKTDWFKSATNWHKGSLYLWFGISCASSR